MKISLVLSGGGARGYIHIGVIEELKAQGYEIASISGTSMGALIGALEACGKLDIYKKWVEELELIDILKFIKPPFKLNGDKIFNKIKELVGEYNIEDLPIKFTAVATDLNKGKEVWFQKGPLWNAVKASAAIPGVFEPVRFHNMLLVDGGVLNLMPVAPVMSDMTDLIIAVNLYGDESKNLNVKYKKETKKKINLLHEMWDKIFEEKEDPTNMSIELMMQVIFRYRRAEYTPDIEIKFPKDTAKWYEFHRALELIEIGRQYTREVLKNEKLKAKSEK
ncbi:patatin [Nautilia profundicola AmH]|uniref:Patatin n=1 Tax=Nautilia profundicola (strain ATCC BAA-1463 / DSM 18972 / AmH) TaxID=598659 RepID=B9L609_NAUPA|nr:patatin-like phospholipase family protein [Nautilia profundicola]ACM93348.1 patatin [Nautilia profundicola AmH]